MMDLILILLLGTCVVRLCTMHKDTREERSHTGYQVFVFAVTLLVYSICFLLIGLIL
jgi:uncharacterized membrane protein